jgi:nucleotide-binding universal stress UspA family protein
MTRKVKEPRRTGTLRVLCATDLLPKSEAAIERAGILAERLMADLSLLHVVVPSGSERALEQDLTLAIAQVKSRARPPLWKQSGTPNIVVKVGPPANRILETVDELRAKLLILGSHRRRSVHDALRGTVAEKVLTSRTSPVLVVNQPPRRAYRNVLVALDMSPTSGHVLRAAESLVMTEEVYPVVVHAHEPQYEGVLSMAYGGIREDMTSAYSRNWASQTEAAVRELLNRHTNDGSRYNVVLEQMRPDVAILRAAQRLQPDLLVMGTRGYGRFRRALLGSVAREVLNATTCDVLIVPEGSPQVPQWGKPGTMKIPAMERATSSAQG